MALMEDVEMYAALRAAGWSNRKISRQLKVSETTVRRMLKKAPASSKRTFVVTVEER